MPAVAFLPKEYQPFAYRLESVDNSFRLTQLDYRYEKPDFDSENTLGKLTFKESSAWESKDEDGTLLYYFNDDIPTLIMAHREAIADAGFDEIDKDQLLADVAEGYVGETGEILRQTPFKLSGYPALCFENTWTDEDLPVAMSLFCYMFIIDDEYYYFGCGEPFLVGESCKRLLPDMLKDFKVGEEASTKSKDSKADDKSADASKTDTSKADASKTDATKTKEATPAKEPAKKTGHPTKDDLLGKVFSQTMTATLTGIEDPSQVYSGSETLPDFLFTADMVAAYNESNGTYSYTETQNGETTTMSMTFSYNADGKIAYSGPVSITAAQFTGTGTVTGVEK